MVSCKRPSVHRGNALNRHPESTRGHANRGVSRTGGRGQKAAGGAAGPRLPAARRRGRCSKQLEHRRRGAPARGGGPCRRRRRRRPAGRRSATSRLCRGRTTRSSVPQTAVTGAVKVGGGAARPAATSATVAWRAAAIAEAVRAIWRRASERRTTASATERMPGTVMASASAIRPKPAGARSTSEVTRAARQLGQAGGDRAAEGVADQLEAARGRARRSRRRCPRRRPRRRGAREVRAAEAGQVECDARLAQARADLGPDFGRGEDAVQEDDRDALAGPDARQQRALAGEFDLVGGGASVHGAHPGLRTLPEHRGCTPNRHPEKCMASAGYARHHGGLGSSVGQLVGRDRELGHLQATLDALDGGGAACLTVEGEPGIGKTRLLTSCGARAEERGHVVLAGAAAEFEREMPFSVWVDALDAYVVAQGLTDHEGWDADLAAELGQVLPSLRSANGDSGRDRRRALPDPPRGPAPAGADRRRAAARAGARRPALERRRLDRADLRADRPRAGRAGPAGARLPARARPTSASRRPSPRRR